MSSGSARLDIVANPITLERTHVQMNKFSGPKCQDYKSIVGEIHRIRRNFQLDVDTEILENSYTVEKLQIQRLSGDFLPIDRCYINLAIVEELDEGDNLSLFGRLGVEEPDSELQVSLPELFMKRQGTDNREIQPRRILIRGRAGVGKTTLGKKIVHDFKNGKLWPELFGRLLWVPLRNLKQKDRQIAGYGLGDLFHHEYFSDRSDGKALADELWERVKSRDTKTLFLLDGLDEVLQGWESSSDVFRFIGELLNRDDVIITSRPYATLYPGMKPVDLEVETIGFYPDQVQEYLRMSFQDEDNGKKLVEIQNFLEEHPLLKDLFRIPIQLDAFCYTWKDVAEEKSLQTMTAVYQAVEVGLWRKDYYRLNNLPSESTPTPSPKEMETIFIKEELAILEVIAFAGLYIGVVNYEPIHQDAMAELEEYKAAVSKTHCSLYQTFACLSFLRTPNSTSSPDSRTYHFMHLTFQEYFAARYFVRQWEAQKALSCRTFDDQHIENYEPIAFLQRYKYNPRYNIMWRFVTGLLASKPRTHTKLNHFFDTIDKEPRDILGLAHYRLIMHCLHQVPIEEELEAFTPLRVEMEDQLHRWLFRKDAPGYDSRLATEDEFPPRVLNKMLDEASEHDRLKFLRDIQYRTVFHLDTMTLICRWLRNDNSESIKMKVLALIPKGYTALSEHSMQLITDLIEDGNEVCVVQEAIDCLGSWPNLPGSVVQVIAGRLDDDHTAVAHKAARTLGRQSALPYQVIQSLARQIENDDLDHDSMKIVRILLKQANLPEQVVQLIENRLAGEFFMHHAASFVYHAASFSDYDLPRPSKLRDRAIEVLTDRLEDGDERLRVEAIESLKSQLELSLLK